MLRYLEGNLHNQRCWKQGTSPLETPTFPASSVAKDQLFLQPNPSEPQQLQHYEKGKEGDKDWGEDSQDCITFPGYGGIACTSWISAQTREVAQIYEFNPTILSKSHPLTTEMDL